MGVLKSSETAPRVWVRCQVASDIDLVNAIEELSLEDGLPIEFVPTLPDGENDGAVDIEPFGKEGLQSFLGLCKPRVMLQIGGRPDAAVMQQLQRQKIPMILANATGEGLPRMKSWWLTRPRKRLFSQFSAILAKDTAIVARYRQYVYDPSVVIDTGPMAGIVHLLPDDPSIRNDFGQAIGTRQTWFAAALPMAEVDAVIEAHKAASRRAHRLLLVVSPQTQGDGNEMASRLRVAGFEVGQTSQGDLPRELTQVLLLDDGVDFGLWYRLCPVTYLGGSLIGAQGPNPYDAAGLGSAIIAGSGVGAFSPQFTQLAQARAAIIVSNADDLGGAVEHLLSADKAATMAHAAWDVTTKGAVVNKRVITLIRDHLRSGV